MLRAALDAIFPPACAACGRGAWPFCADCAATLVGLGGAACRRCGVPDAAEPDGCPSCPPGLDRVLAPFAYEGAARAAILRLKFSGRRSVAAALASPMASAIGDATTVLTFVPLGAARRRERGFDQARLLAREVGRVFGVAPARLLARVRETAPQARRGAGERREAMRGAFAAVGEMPAAVVLVDDVCTTGATAAACADALRAAGCREVTLLAAARAIPRSYTRVGSASGSVVARGIAPR